MGQAKNMPNRRGRVYGVEALPRRTRVAAERDAWIGAGQGRTFEVCVNRARSEWQVTLTERGRVVASGAGDTWEIALDAALEAARSNVGT